jgi:hypothetical protein
MQALLKAQINKTDRNDARGIAQMMRVGLYRPDRRLSCWKCDRNLPSFSLKRESPIEAARASPVLASWLIVENQTQR